MIPSHCLALTKLSRSLINKHDSVGHIPKWIKLLVRSYVRCKRKCREFYQIIAKGRLTNVLIEQYDE